MLDTYTIPPLSNSSRPVYQCCSVCRFSVADLSADGLCLDCERDKTDEAWRLWWERSNGGRT